MTYFVSEKETPLMIQDVPVWYAQTRNYRTVLRLQCYKRYHNRTLLNKI